MFEDHISITSKVFKRKIFKKAYFWIVLVLGVLFIVLGKIDSIPLLPDWKSLFTTLGTILLTSGIFTSLLKTIQYLDIIKEELSKIIYEVDYLKTRNDIDNLWKKINRVVFGERFAEISEAIQKDIKRVYLPNNLERYYKNYRFDISIEKNGENPNYIEVRQIVTVEVITNDPKDSKKLFYRNKLIRDTDNADDLTSLELLYWKINNVPQEIVETVNSTADKPEFEITLHGEKSYLLERKTKSVYSMKVDPFKSFIEKNYIIDSMTVDISYPEDLKCQFWGIGTLEKFKSINTTSPNRIIRKYDGLIYKNQGFRIYFQAR